MLSTTRRRRAGVAFLKKLPMPPMPDEVPDLNVLSSYVSAGIDLCVSQDTLLFRRFDVSLCRERSQWVRTDPISKYDQICPVVPQGLPSRKLWKVRIKMPYSRLVYY